MPISMDTPERLLQYIEGRENPAGSGLTIAYFTAPKEARDLMNGFGLVAVENILCTKEPEINALDEEEYQKWLEICYRLGRDPNLLGTGEHLLYIGKKTILKEKVVVVP